MRHLLFPSHYEESFLQIDFAALQKQGILGLILDIDNTIEPYFVPEPSAAVKDKLQEIDQLGLPVFIVSNGRRERVERFNQDLRYPYICHAGKPSPKGFLAAVRTLGIDAGRIAVIGDQIFTDVLGGNRLGMYTILVGQVSPKDEWMTAVKRPLEKIVWVFYRKYRKKAEKA